LQPCASNVALVVRVDDWRICANQTMVRSIRRGQSLPKGRVVRHGKIDCRMAEMGQNQ